MDWEKGAQYWDKCWNPVIGCKPVSEGCRNCYAKRIAERFGLVKNFNEELHYTKTKPPKSGVVFVGDMCDVFEERHKVSDIRWWLGMLNDVDCVNLVLTKRPERMKKVVSEYSELSDADWIFYGMTAENQKELIRRVVPFSEAIWDKTSWLSAEPLLGPLDLMATAQIENEHNEGYGCEIIKAFDWVVVGAESGPYRRPCNLEWVESVVEQCQSAGVPVFVKQLDIGGKLIKDIEKFPEHLRIRQVPWGGKE